MRCARPQTTHRLSSRRGLGISFLNVQLPRRRRPWNGRMRLPEGRGPVSKTPGVKDYTTVGGFSLLTRVSTHKQCLLLRHSKAMGERTGPGWIARHSRQHQRAAPRTRSGGHRHRVQPACDSGPRKLEAASPSGYRTAAAAPSKNSIRTFRNFSGPHRSGRSWSASIQRSRPACPRYFATVDRDKTLKQGVA